MKSLKIIIAMSAGMFFTTGVFASQQPETSSVAPADSLSESSKVSTAEAVSLFSFISVEKASKDTTSSAKVETTKGLNLLDIIQTYF